MLNMLSPLVLDQLTPKMVKWGLIVRGFHPKDHMTTHGSGLLRLLDKLNTLCLCFPESDAFERVRFAESRAKKSWNIGQI